MLLRSREDVSIKQYVKFGNIDFSGNLTYDFQFFLDHDKDHNLPH